MPGVKGAGGPIPKRSDQRRRTNKPAVPIAEAPASPAVVKFPAADRKWHPVARRWYESLGRSGQARWYEPSDWGLAFLLAESISRELTPRPIFGKDGKALTDLDDKPVLVALPVKGAALSAWLKGMTSLLVSEGDRRRSLIELSRPQPADEGGDNVSFIDDVRRRLAEPG